MSLDRIRRDMTAWADPKRAAVSLRFFKTGPGEYGAGDVFAGLAVPKVRALARTYRDLPLRDVRTLLRSKVHEERQLALFILVDQFRKADESARKVIYDLYLSHTRYVNNWDLVDGSAEHIVGLFLKDKPKTPLFRLAKSNRLWERRIAMLSTFVYIKSGEFGVALRIARMLLHDREDLIHKAVGWMLREIGQRDRDVEEEFLTRHAAGMPRTMLRYAIEKFPASLRKKYMTAES